MTPYFEQWYISNEDHAVHKEIIERQTTAKYLQAAKLANKGLSFEEISKQVDIPRGELDLIVKVNRERPARVPGWADAAFVGLIFLRRLLVLADQRRGNDQDAGEPRRQYEHQQQRPIVVEVGAVHVRCAAIIASERTLVNEVATI